MLRRLDLRWLVSVSSDRKRAYSAADVEEALDLAKDRRAARHDFVEDLVDGFLLEDVPLAEAGEEVAQRLLLEEALAREVADRDRSEVGGACERADRGEFGEDQLDSVGPSRIAIGDRFDNASRVARISPTA